MFPFFHKFPFKTHHFSKKTPKLTVKSSHFEQSHVLPYPLGAEAQPGMAHHSFCLSRHKKKPDLLLAPNSGAFSYGQKYQL